MIAFVNYVKEWTNFLYKIKQCFGKLFNCYNCIKLVSLNRKEFKVLKGRNFCIVQKSSRLFLSYLIEVQHDDGDQESRTCGKRK